MKIETNEQANRFEIPESYIFRGEDVGRQSVQVILQSNG